MSIKTKKILRKLNKGSFTFGQLLLSLRKADEVTQAELARRLNVSKGLVCDIEKGRRLASIHLAAQIAKVMGYPEVVMIKQLFEDQLQAAKIKCKVKLEAS